MVLWSLSTPTTVGHSYDARNAIFFIVDIEHPFLPCEISDTLATFHRLFVPWELNRSPGTSGITHILQTTRPGDQVAKVVTLRLPPWNHGSTNPGDSILGTIYNILSLLHLISIWFASTQPQRIVSNATISETSPFFFFFFFFFYFFNSPVPTVCPVKVFGRRARLGELF